MTFRITTWNVNGIRNPFSYAPWNQSRTFQAMFDILEADIVIIQETKIQRKDLRDDMVLVPGWDVFFSLPSHKKGYSGVAVYTRNSKCCPIRAEEGLLGVLSPSGSSTKFRDLPPDHQIGGYPRADQLDGLVDDATLDSEGRCVILEFPAFVLIGVYSPAMRDDSRTDFRLGFLHALDARVRNLIAMGKQVVLAGDLNIIRSDLDSAGLLEQLRREGMAYDAFISTPSRRFFQQLIFDGNVIGERDKGRERPVMWDLCREFHANRQGMYTCWETKKNARPGNYGSRIDYILCTSGIKDWFRDSNIQEGLMGSDHCPVYATLTDIVSHGGENVFLADLMNPPDMFRRGERLREWATKDLLPMSAKLVPEFNLRRSIKDMLFKKATPSRSKSIDGSSENSKHRVNAGQPSCKQFSGYTADTAAESTSETVNEASKVAPSTLTALKRHVQKTSNQPQKKQRMTLAKDKPKTGPGLAQSSLRGFFRPKTSATTPHIEDAGAAPGQGMPSSKQSGIPMKENVMAGPEDEAVRSVGNDEKRMVADHDKVFDPIQSKESWSKLLGKRVAPRCEHNEPCISMVTKKSGMNCGRSFYICPRPLGPSGQKEKGTQWRCGTFIWSSDWKDTS